MRIAVVGRGNVGGGLAARWRAAGHEVTELGREGGDVTAAEVVLLAVPGAAIADALARVTGLEGKPVVDATNHTRGERPPFASLAHQVRSITGGPVAKAFNLEFARVYDEIDAQRVPPSCLYCGDEGARDAAEVLIRAAGYQPVSAGSLDNARGLEDMLGVVFAVAQQGLGPHFHRFAAPGSL